MGVLWHRQWGNVDFILLQDFEALTPNLLARTVETVEGGGIIVLLLSSMDSLSQLYSLTMDVHARLRTASHQDVTGDTPSCSFHLSSKQAMSPL